MGAPPGRGYTESGHSRDAELDLNLADWQAAERRLSPAPAGSAAGPAGPAAAPAGPAAAPAGPASERRRNQRWIPVTRVWSVLYLASMFYSTWWAMGFIHARLGETICAYGAVCLVAGFYARWRKLYFCPGQRLEPELYEDIGQWLYRAGSVVVLAGGAVYLAQLLIERR